MKEPTKYSSGPKGGLQLTKEWKDWRKQVLSNGFQAHNAKKEDTKYTVGKTKKVSPENHKENWKEVAWISGTERRILFCCCQAQTGMPYAGCGAVGVRETRGGKVTIVVESRFE